MELDNIVNLSKNIIFDEIEKEAQLKYEKYEKINFNDDLKLAIPHDLLKQNINISSYSNHSYKKSVSLFYCFEYIKEWITYKKHKDQFDFKYVYYINENLEFIDFNGIEKNELDSIFRSIIANLQLIKFSSNLSNKKIEEYTNFIFEIIFKCISNKEEKVLRSLIESMIKMFSINPKDYYVSSDKFKTYIFETNLILFEHLFEYIYSASFLSKNKIFEIIFNMECIYFNDENSQLMIKKILKKGSLNVVSSHKSCVELANELLVIHDEYLNYCKNEYSKITFKNKNKYLKIYKEQTDPIQYIFILHYLNDIKQYLKYKLK